ncbi:MAG TPA: hypothetical protein VGB82_13285 [Alphaproteobacteria bacterium]
MSLDGFLLFVFAIASTFWLMWALGRLNGYWIAATKRKRELNAQRVGMRAQLLNYGKELVRLQSADAETAERLAELRADCAKRQKELAAVVPRAPPEITVTSEYAPSKDDKAWIVQLSQPVSARGRGGANKKQYLVWAVDQGAAASRAHNIVSDEPGYEVQDVWRYM